MRIARAVYWNNTRAYGQCEQLNLKIMDDQTRDPKIKTLLDWVHANGGSHNVIVKENKNGVRGLFSAKSFNKDKEKHDEEHPYLVKIPNNLIVSPYHIQN